VGGGDSTVAVVGELVDVEKEEEVEVEATEGAVVEVDAVIQ